MGACSAGYNRRVPYFVYKISAGATPLLKDLTLLQRFAAFKDAKKFARTERAAQGEDVTIKVTFAETELQAEEQLLTTREAPVLREWEK